jgi:hypothetical protein
MQLLCRFLVKNSCHLGNHHRFTMAHNYRINLTGRPASYAER